MSNIEKYLDQVIIQRPVPAELLHALPTSEAEDQSATNVLKGILRRWYIVLAALLVMCVIGLPAIWTLIDPLYVITGTIHVAPVIPNILTGDADRGEVSNYEVFVNSQAQWITGQRVIQRVADDLKGKNLDFFIDQGSPLVARAKASLNLAGANVEPAAILKQAVLDRIITAAPGRKTEFILVTMESEDENEAKQIVDSFIRNYMAVEVTNAAEQDAQKIRSLEDERKTLAARMQSYQTAINELAKEYGSKNLTSRQDMKLSRVNALLTELTKLEAARINLEIRVKVLEESNEPSVDLDQMMKMRQDYVANDPTVKILATNVAQMEQQLIESQQMMSATNPELARKTELLKTLRERVEERKQEAGKAFDELTSEQITRTGNKDLASARKTLEQTKAQEQQLRDLLSQEDTETIGIGQRQLTIQDQEAQYTLTKELHDTLGRRVQELEMQRRQPGKISVGDWADIADIRDKRIQYSAALAFGSLACGAMLGLLRDKADKRLRTPDDVARRIGIKILGTTTSSRTVAPTHLQQQVAGDYQAIRANLGLLTGNGLPKKLVVASAGTREGKTTFAINLATSIASSGKKVLLIDGDLRKPDIASLLGLPKGSRGLQDVLTGKNIEQAVVTIPSTRLDVLAADAQNALDAFEMLASPMTAQRIDEISEKYDHVIIDTPPILAFSDALIWARIAGNVVLTSFAGQTTAPDLREAKDKLAEINVRVLGTVLSNVEPGRGYYKYGYSYTYKHGRDDVRRSRRKMLLSSVVNKPKKQPGA